MWEKTHCDRVAVFKEAVSGGGRFEGFYCNKKSICKVPDQSRLLSGALDIW